MKKLLAGIFLFSMVFLLGCSWLLPETGESEGAEEQGAPSPTPTPIELDTGTESEGSQPVEARVVLEGDTVKVHYTGTLENGTVFDSSEGKEPLEFVAGAGRMIKGFDNAVIGMKVGEEKDITLQPSEAYGEEDPGLYAYAARSELQEGMDPKVGNVLSVTLPDGSQRTGVVTEINDENIIINLNHRLAGKVLKFHIKLVEIS